MAERERGEVGVVDQHEHLGGGAELGHLTQAEAREPGRALDADRAAEALERVERQRQVACVVDVDLAADGAERGRPEPPRAIVRDEAPADAGEAVDIDKALDGMLGVEVAADDRQRGQRHVRADRRGRRADQADVAAHLAHALVPEALLRHEEEVPVEDAHVVELRQVGLRAHGEVAGLLTAQHRVGLGGGVACVAVGVAANGVARRVGDGVGHAGEGRGRQGVVARHGAGEAQHERRPGHRPAARPRERRDRIMADHSSGTVPVARCGCNLPLNSGWIS
ncbi:MAG: hypothetical protein U1F43_26555 [Myxococcota bacterium]